MENIKSHSSQLFNERMAILLYLLDMESVALYQNNESPELIKKVFSYLQQIYINIRMLLRNDPVMRNTLHLNTNDDGIYITDLMFSAIEKLLMFCNNNQYTTKRCYIIVQEIRDFQINIRDILQYYEYFIRSNFRQKPDISIATDKYKLMTDKLTIDQLRSVVGKNHKIDFDNFDIKELDEFVEDAPVLEEEEVEDTELLSSSIFDEDANDDIKV